jgi:toxin ParE1/3/4
MRSVRLLESAAAEAEEAAAWYEGQREGLGADFRKQLKVSLDALRRNPLPGSPWPGRLGDRGVKRTSMKRFPFFLVFVTVDAGCVVLAIAHHRRRPGYWRNRIPDTKPG